jgi:hypothetical protein
VELRLDIDTNGWVWSRSQGYACDPAVASGSASAAPLEPFVQAVIAALVLLLAGMAAYVALTRLRVRRQLEQLTAKTTLASRAMDRARLLALQATPNAPEFTINFETGTVRTVAELMGEAPPTPTQQMQRWARSMACARCCASTAPLRSWVPALRS